jgi:hypothetical protein
LLQYLGSLAPEVFSKPCAECGNAVPLGTACLKCKTEVYAVGANPAALLAIATAAAPSDPNAFSSFLLRGRWDWTALPRRVQLRLYVLWAHVHNLLAMLRNAGRTRTAKLSALRLRLVAFAEQIALLCSCAWPREERARNPDGQPPSTPRTPRQG